MSVLGSCFDHGTCTLQSVARSRRRSGWSGIFCRMLQGHRVAWACHIQKCQGTAWAAFGGSAASESAPVAPLKRNSKVVPEQQRITHHGLNASCCTPSGHIRGEKLENPEAIWMCNTGVFKSRSHFFGSSHDCRALKPPKVPPFSHATTWETKAKGLQEPSFHQPQVLCHLGVCNGFRRFSSVIECPLLCNRLAKSWESWHCENFFSQSLSDRTHRNRSVQKIPTKSSMNLLSVPGTLLLCQQSRSCRWL